MYSDPGKVRRHRIALNLNDYEATLVNALAEIEGGEPAALLRKILMDHIEATLAQKTSANFASHGANFDAAEAPIQHAN